MDLPEITKVQRYRYAPGDRFIVTVPARMPVSDKMAGDIVRRFRAAAGLPDGTPVIVLADDWEVTIAGPDEPCAPCEAGGIRHYHGDELYGD